MKGEVRASRPGRSRNPDGVHLWLVLWKASRAVGAHALRSIEAQPICGSDFAVLEAVLHKGPLPVNDIGRRVGLTSGSISTAVDRVEALRLVDRRAHPSDRRTRLVHLTPAGKRLISSVFLAHARDMERAASALSTPERATLIRLLKKLGYHAERSLTVKPAPIPKKGVNP